MNTLDHICHPEPDPARDLDHDEFRRGFAEAVDHLESLPATWACHHATSTLEQPVATTHTRSHARGYRAALFGYLRGGPLYSVPTPIADPAAVAVLGLRSV